MYFLTVTIQWQEDGIIPAKLLLFWDINFDSFKRPFKFGSTHVSGPGTYVIAYSLLSTETAIKAHGASNLVKYAELDPLQDLCIIPVESILSPIISLPYQIKDNIITAKEWILLQPKSSWKNIFFDFMKTAMSNSKKSNPTGNSSAKVSNKRKRKHHGDD